MLVPLSWLRDFAPFEGDARALGEVFDELGMVVEGINKVGEGLGGVYVAKVLEVHAIPKADRIRRIIVDDGSGDPVQVVCGAWNFDVGATVPFARVGAVLPGDFEIGRRKMKGVESSGMICSARELELGTEGAGIMVLPDGLEAGMPLAEALGIEADVVFDLAIEGNRPDANSVIGVARDAAAKLKLPFAIPEHPVDTGGPATGELASITVEATDLCPRFTATAITGVAIGPGPELVARRLTLAGMRPISNVVDASNYVMLEMGQPTHPYDLDRLPGRGLSVRRARPGETLVTLDGVERRVGDGDDCLICDAEGTPVGIGGIMGGASSEISDQTTTVLLEAAYFAPMAIARTSKRLALRTEASARFERGTDPEGIERSVDRFCSLLGVGQRSPGMLDERSIAPRREAIRVRLERVNAVLGTDLDTSAVTGYLQPIGFEASAEGDGILAVTPPSFRPDTTLEVDVIEEVARHHGYRSIPRTVPSSPYVGRLTTYQRGRRLLREVLAGAGYHEAVASPLLGPGDHARAGLTGVDEIVAVDPLAREESILRASLLPGLLRGVAFNAAHRVADIRLFEVGNVFTAADRGADLPEETERVTLVVAGPDGGAIEAKRLLDLLAGTFHHDDVRLVATSEAPGLHPSRTAAVHLGDTVAGHVGEIHPAVLEAYGIEGRVGVVDLVATVLVPSEARYVQARAVSKLPSSDIDLAFVVDDATPAGDVERALRQAAGELLVDLRLFDVYRGAQAGDGRRSLAYRLRFQSLDRTLTDAEVSEIRQRCIDAVESAFPATLRG